MARFYSEHPGIGHLVSRLFHPAIDCRGKDLLDTTLEKLRGRIKMPSSALTTTAGLGTAASSSRK